MSHPSSPFDKESGLVWVPRMFDKARMMQKGTLPEEYHANLGKGHDARCCEFLGVDYEDIKEKIEDGQDNAAVLAWCFETGRIPDEFQTEMWNAYLSKLGFMDENPGFAEYIAKRKKAYGLVDRDDIRTFFQLIEKDEGRID